MLRTAQDGYILAILDKEVAQERERESNNASTGHRARQTFSYALLTAARGHQHHLLEDPIEYAIPGIVRVQVKLHLGCPWKKQPSES
jgi:hypothetical protein